MTNRRVGPGLAAGIGTVLAALLLVGGVGMVAAPAAAAAVTPAAPLVAAQSAGPRPGNGAVLTDRGPNGRGVFRIENGTASDAVVALARDGRRLHAVYVRAGAKATVSGIADGSYAVFVHQGSGWDAGRRAFRTDVTYVKFAATADYRTVRKGRKINYISYEATLQPVPNGNAPTVPVDPAAFPQ